ncbi:unnamed protein product [Tenebrio molitor]|nr:unnamed protein product [Tenebrio molitor]
MIRYTLDPTLFPCHLSAEESRSEDLKNYCVFLCFCALTV